MNTDVFLFPLACATVSFVLVFHTKIDGVLFIRWHFEYEYIFSPIVQEVFGATALSNKFLFKDRRSALVFSLFYKWASSTDDSVVQKHDIHEALTNWSWFWIALELSVFNLILTIVSYFLIGTCDYVVISTALVIALFTLISSWRSAKKLIKPQIQQILKDPDAVRAIQSEWAAQIR